MTEKNDLVRVFTGSQVEVAYIAERLKENGIACLVKDDFQSGINAGFATSTPDAIDIYVEQEKEQEAIVLIEKLKQEDK